jgi:hypothetical protein
MVCIWLVELIGISCGLATLDVGPTFRQLRKLTFLNDWLWKVATGRNGREAEVQGQLTNGGSTTDN